MPKNQKPKKASKANKKAADSAHLVPYNEAQRLQEAAAAGMAAASGSAEGDSTFREALLGAATQYECALAIKPADLSTLVNYGTVLLDLARNCSPLPSPEESDSLLARACASFEAVDENDTSRRSQPLLAARVNRLAALAARGDLARMSGPGGFAAAEAFYAEACSIVNLDALGDWSLEGDAEAMYNVGDAFGHRANLRLESPEPTMSMLEEAAELGHQALAAYATALQLEPPGPTFDSDVLIAAATTASDLSNALLAAQPQPPSADRVTASSEFAQVAFQHASMLYGLWSESSSVASAGNNYHAKAFLQLGLAQASLARAQIAAQGVEAAASVVADAVAAFEAAASSATSIGPVASEGLVFQSCAAAGEFLLDYARLLTQETETPSLVSARAEMLAKAATALESAVGHADSSGDSVTVTFNLCCVAALMGDAASTERCLVEAVNRAEAAGWVDEGGDLLPSRDDITEDEDLAMLWCDMTSRAWLTALVQRVPP